jgi:hypothetical protein
MAQPRAVLGAEIVRAIDADTARTVLPSWAPSGPQNFGTSDHGKLKADEWRITGLVRLVVTLPRVWGPRGGRHKLMLDNFMHLASAIIIGSSLSTINVPTAENGARKSTATLYCEAYQAYLQGVLDLYPTAKIKANMHIAYHIGMLLDNYGPVHSWRAWVFERFYGIIQDLPTNMRFGAFRFSLTCPERSLILSSPLGELETTLMRGFCLGANLKAYVTDSTDVEAIRDLRKDFESAFFSDAQGTLLHDLLGLESNGGIATISHVEKMLRNAPRDKLDSMTEQLLVDCLNKRYPHPQDIYIRSNQRMDGHSSVDPEAWSLTQWTEGGVLYRRARPSRSTWSEDEVFSPHKDSHVIVRFDNCSAPCIILDLFAHRHVIPKKDSPEVECFAIIKRYLDLAPNHCALDHWRCYPVSGGSLYYDELYDQVDIVHIKDITAHFAKTPFSPGELPGIDRPCIHVLPLDWVSKPIQFNIDR